MVVVLNKMDLLQKRRITIDEGLLGQALGCPVVSLSAHNRQQVAAFKEQIHRFIGQPQPALVLDYGQPLEADIAELETLLAPHHLSDRGRALRLLEEDIAMQETLAAGQQAAAGNVVSRAHHAQDIDLQLADLRYGHIHHWSQQACRQQGELTVAQSEWLDRALLNRWVGIPFFLLVMYLMFMFAIKVGSAFIDFFDILGGALFVDGVHHLLGLAAAPRLAGSRAGGRRRRRPADGGDLHPRGGLPLPVPRRAGELGLPGSRRLRGGCPDAPPRAARQGVRSHADGLWLHSACGDGSTRTLGSERRKADDLGHGTLHVVRCPAAGLCPVRGGLLPRSGQNLVLWSLPARHPGGGAHRPLPAQHPCCRARATPW